MSFRHFARIIRGVMETLPDELKQYLDNVVIDVEEEPDAATLRDIGFTEEEIAAGDTAYGLFSPMEVPAFGDHDTDVPHRIVIYKQPLEEDFPDRAELERQIRKTVIHELAHHFGYSDDDLERWTTVY